MNVSVILPTYNESKNIVPLIEAIQHELGQAGISHEVLVVDDNSPDGTAAMVRERFGGDERVRLFVRTEERGLATAIAHGIRQAQGESVAVMDTDFNHDPVMLPQMVKFLEYYDIVIGSRFVMGGGMEQQWRYNASFLFNFFVRIVLHTQIQDNLCGFFTMRRDKLLAMDIDAHLSRLWRLFHAPAVCSLACKVYHARSAHLLHPAPAWPEQVALFPYAAQLYQSGRADSPGHALGRTGLPQRYTTVHRIANAA